MYKQFLRFAVLLTVCALAAVTGVQAQKGKNKATDGEAKAVPPKTALLQNFNCIQDVETLFAFSTARSGHFQLPNIFAPEPLNEAIRRLMANGQQSAVSLSTYQRKKE